MLWLVGMFRISVVCSLATHELYPSCYCTLPQVSDPRIIQMYVDMKESNKTLLGVGNDASVAEDGRKRKKYVSVFSCPSFCLRVFARVGLCVYVCYDLLVLAGRERSTDALVVVFCLCVFACRLCFCSCARHDSWVWDSRAKGRVWRRVGTVADTDLTPRSPANLKPHPTQVREEAGSLRW